MKTLSRPMFRRGGGVSAKNNGIVSGFENGGRVELQNGGGYDIRRQLLQFGSTKNQAAEYETDPNIQALIDQYVQDPVRQKGLSTSDWLRIASAGADIMGAQPTSDRGGFIGALQAASPSLGSLGKDLATSAGAKEAAYQAKLDAANRARLGIQLSDIERFEKEKAAKEAAALKYKQDQQLLDQQQTFQKELLANEIQGKLDIEAAKASDIANRITLSAPLHQELGEIIAQKEQLFANPDATIADKSSILSQIQSLNYQISGIMGQAIDVGDLSDAEQKNIRYTSENMAQNDMGLEVGQEPLASELGQEKYKKYVDLVEAYKQFYIIQSIMALTPGLRSANAEGGRVGLQQGGDPMMAQAMQQPMQQPQTGSVGLTFEELRARLPQEVSDGVVRLLATSEEALLDFANLQTQEDIAQFNQKYNTDLQLPAQVA